VQKVGSKMSGHPETWGVQVAFMNKWVNFLIPVSTLFQYIQVPLHFILLEVLIACVLRSIYAVIMINKYRHKLAECYKTPIMGESYYYGASDYAVVSF
jgi:hypothetical protein